MSRMSPEERADLLAALGDGFPAAPKLVLAAVQWQYALRRTPSSAEADRLAWKTADAVPAIARRLLNAETELTTIRATLARLLAENDHGDDHSLSDLRHELERAGIHLTPEYTAAEALARAAESETL